MNDKDEPDELTPGTLLQGKYRIERTLGGGGMSHVYLATYGPVERHVVIKAIAAGGDVDLHQARVLREARLRRAFTGKGVVQLFDTFVEGGLVYLVEEFIDGPELGRWQKDRPLSEIQDIYASIAEALAGIHAASLLHRDIKPSNILIAQDGRPRVADFGLVVRPREVDNLTAPGRNIIGTPTYMAPEIIRGVEPVGPGVDVYALGVMLFEALTGKLPGGAGEDATGFMELALHRLRGYGAEDLAPLDSIGVPHLRSLIARMLALDPNDRPSAAAVARELRGVAEVEKPVVMGSGSWGPYPSVGVTQKVGETLKRIDIDLSPEQGGHMWAFSALPALLVLSGVMAAWLTATPTVRPVVPAWVWLALACVLALIAGVALVVIGLRRAPRRRRRELAEMAPVMARLQVLEAHIKSRDKLTESVAIAVDEIGSRLDPQRLASVIRESVLLALKELSPKDLPANSDMARALETIAQLTRPKDTKKTFWERWGSTVTVCSGTVSLVAGILGLLFSLGMVSPNHPPEIKAIGPTELRARSHGTLLISADASDPDGDPLKYSWRVDRGTIDENGNFARWTPPVDNAVRTFQLQVTVTDGRRSVERSRTVTVNAPPTGKLVITPPAGPGGTFRIEARAEDADGDALKYEWRDSTGKLPRDAGGVVFLESPRPGVPVDVVCQVSDGLESVTLDGRVP